MERSLDSLLVTDACRCVGRGGMQGASQKEGKKRKEWNNLALFSDFSQWLLFVAHAKRRSRQCSTT